MLIIGNDGSIRVTRGDSFSATLFINRGTEFVPMRYVVGDNDTVYFGVMEPNQRFEDAIVRKSFNAKSVFNENKDLVISFEPKDTEYLLPGRYYYTVKLRRMNDDGTYRVDTLIPDRQFFIER